MGDSVDAMGKATLGRLALPGCEPGSVRRNVALTARPDCSALEA